MPRLRDIYDLVKGKLYDPVMQLKNRSLFRKVHKSDLIDCVRHILLEKSTPTNKDLSSAWESIYEDILDAYPSAQSSTEPDNNISKNDHSVAKAIKNVERALFYIAERIEKASENKDYVLISPKHINALINHVYIFSRAAEILKEKASAQSSDLKQKYEGRKNVSVFPFSDRSHPETRKALLQAEHLKGCANALNPALGHYIHGIQSSQDRTEKLEAHHH